MSSEMSRRKDCVVWMLVLLSLSQCGLIMSLNEDEMGTNDLLYIASVLRSTPHAVKALRIFRDILKSVPRDDVNVTSQCLVDLESVLQAVVGGKTWALKIVDASSKIPSGLLRGNIADLGEYDECVDVGSSTTPTDIEGQHCLVSVNVITNSSLVTGTEGVSDALGGSLQLTLAWCLPKRCRMDEIEQALEGLTQIINQFVPAGNNITLTIGPTDCHIKEDVPFTVLEWFALVTCLLLASVVVLSTAYDWKNSFSGSIDSSTKDKLLTSFSVVNNGRRLLSTATGSESLPVLNCLKVLSIFWVIVGHKFRYTAENPLINLLELPGELKYMGNMLILNAPLSVDVFFIISALLATYGYLKVGHSKRVNIKLHFLNFIHRYLRLTPAFALMMLFTVTLLYRSGDGPMWDKIVGHAKQDCVSYWWSGLLYINNYYNPDNSCMMQSWYLAADMQLYLFAPLVLYPLLKWPRWGLVLVSICVVFSVAIPFYVAFVEEIQAPIALSRNSERVRRETDALYIPTHTKTISYVIGILLGYILFQIKVKKAPFKLKKRTNFITWLVAVVLLVTSLFGCYPFYQLDETYNKWTSSLYIGFYRLGWSLGIGWIILACSTGHGGFINTFTCWGIFGPLGRLTYCVYLVHVAVILVGLGSMRNAQYFNYYNILTSCFGEFVISLFFAMLLTLVMESPLMVIEKIILQRKPRRTIFSVTTGVPSTIVDFSQRKMSSNNS